MRKALIARKIFTGRSVVYDKAVVITDDIIEDIVEIDAIPQGYEKEDLGGGSLAPAFIDLQIYGGNGQMFHHELSIASLQATYEYCKSGGASHFMITMATNSIEKFLRAINIVKDYWSKGGKGLLGLHLEGPYLNPVKKGAHIERLIKKPVMEEVLLLISEGKDVIRMITLAPEMCDEAIIEELLENNILVSAGHSNATYKEGMNAFNGGVPLATHLFNAMSAFQSREPGLVGAILDHPHVRSSIVCDGIHVDFASVRVSKKLMQDRLFFITDAVTEIRTGEYHHILKGDRYTLPDGTLSGSTLTMMQCVRNATQHVGISLEECLKMASTYPGEILGNQLGKIEKGYKPCFVVFDDALHVERVINYCN